MTTYTYTVINYKQENVEIDNYNTAVQIYICIRSSCIRTLKYMIPTYEMFKSLLRLRVMRLIFNIIFGGVIIVLA